MSKRSQNRSQQRGRILDAARLLFAERGFDDVTVSEIAEKCGVARATIFNHFRSKHALIEAITAGVFAYYQALLDRALADERASVPQLVRALFSYMGAGIEGSQQFYRGAFGEIVRVQVGLAESGVAREASLAASRSLEQLLERGRERSELRSELSAPELARSFTALSHGTITSWLYEDRSVSLRELMERAADVFLGGVATAEHTGGADAIPDLTTDWFALEPPTRPPGDRT